MCIMTAVEGTCETSSESMSGTTPAGDFKIMVMTLCGQWFVWLVDSCHRLFF